MKRFAALVFFLALAGCATTNSNGTPTPIGTFDACSDTALKTAAEGILGQIATALSTGDYEAQLAILVGQTSAAEVLCGVQLAVNEFGAKAAVDSLAAFELANGKSYLAAHTPKPVGN